MNIFALLCFFTKIGLVYFYGYARVKKIIHGIANDFSIKLTGPACLASRHFFYYPSEKFLRIFLPILNTHVRTY